MTEGSPTTVRYTMTVDDLVDGQRLVQRSFRRFRAAVGALVAVAGVGLALTGDTVLGAVLIFYGILDLAIVLAGRPVERFAMRRRAARLIGNECEVSLTESVVTFRNGGTKGEIAWSDLTGIREDAHTMGFASGGVLRLGIPKRAFASEAELAAFRREPWLASWPRKPTSRRPKQSPTRETVRFRTSGEVTSIPGVAPDSESESGRSIGSEVDSRGVRSRTIWAIARARLG